MTESSRTASTRQGILIIGGVLLFAVVVGLSVLPTFRPVRSRLVGLPGPDFTLPVMTGGEPGSRVHLKDYRGQVVVVDFWASWCAPCRAEAPILDKVSRERRGKGVQFLGVATGGDDWGRAVEFVKSHGVGYTTLFDDGDHVSNAFLVRELPTLVVLDSEGVVVSAVSRMLHETEIEAMIDEALSRGAAKR